MGGSSPAPAPTATTTTQISPQAQQLFDVLYPKIQTYAASPPPQYYPTSTVTPFNPTQETAQNTALLSAIPQFDIAGRATTLATDIPGMLQWGGLPESMAYTPPDIARTALPAQKPLLSNPELWDPGLNPALNSAIEAAQRPIYQNLTESVLPAIRQTAISTGPFGGSRQEIAEGLAASRAGQQATDVAAKMAMDAYSTNVQAQNANDIAYLNALNQRYGTDIGADVSLAGQGVTARGQDISQYGQQYGQNLAALYQTLGLTPTLQAAWGTPAAQIGAVGDVQQQQAQNELNADVARWNYNQTAPFTYTQNLLGMIPALPGGTTISTGSVPPGPSTGQQALGGAMTGAALGSLLPIPGGSLVGAGAGALMPFLF